MNKITFIANLLFALSLVIFSPDSKSESLDMFIWANDLAPIISHEDSGKTRGAISEYQGVMVDVLDSLPHSVKPQINVILSSRRRGEKELYDGNIDFTILSPKWIEFPEKLIFTLPIYVHKEYLYAIKAIPDKSVEALVEGKRVCTRSGYRYPGIARFIESGVAKRVDSEDEHGQFKLLFRGRCDFVLTNEFAANKVINKNNWEAVVSASKVIIDQTGYTLAFHPKHQAFVDIMNKHIAHLLESGELDKFITRQTR
ncbi:substrate-binding periplasmic protein [Glaciecola sp.]|jgi:ABC-type amino acid transport substrate-binding protein|uniref:substrate-binding periplasmic protein n=1 Tax=Glaciecola sp. MF2-115 TaxID=3384827 RepID=UPI003988FFD9